MALALKTTPLTTTHTHTDSQNREHTEAGARTLSNLRWTVYQTLYITETSNKFPQCRCEEDEGAAVQSSPHLQTQEEPTVSHHLRSDGVTPEPPRLQGLRHSGAR